MRGIDSNIIEEVARLLGELITGSKITMLFSMNGWKDHYTETGDKMLSTKWKRIYNTILYEMNKTNSINPFIKIIEDVMQPFTFRDNIDIWKENKRDLNRIIGFCGLELLDDGKLKSVEPTKTLQEAIERTDSLIEKLKVHNIHREIIDYCRPELLNGNYFHAILEASKSVLQRIRDLTNSSRDGNTLINEAFILKNPSLVIKGNRLNDEHEKSQYQGLKSLLNTICYLYRNSTAHSPKLFNPSSEQDAIQAFLLISMAHKHLDNCECVRFID